MATVKMGMTIEEAAECSGIGRNTMRKLVEWRKLPVLKVGRKTIIRSDTLERFMTVQPGTESAGQGRCAGRGVMRASQKGVSGANATTKASPFESEIYPSHKPSVCTLCISPCRGLPPLARRCGLGQSAQRRTALNRPCAPLSLHAPADTAGGRTEA